MAIRMRVNKDSESQCCECEALHNESVELFDICVGGEIITLCDLCVSQLSDKTMSATCMVNHKVKSAHEMSIIRKRVNDQHMCRREVK